MAQVGLSTIVALLPLLFKQSYLAMVFLKTIVVVVLLGMFHGLVLLPAVLTMITRYPQKSAASSAESSERSSQRSTERKESFYNVSDGLGLHRMKSFFSVSAPDSFDQQGARLASHQNRELPQE